MYDPYSVYGALDPDQILEQIMQGNVTLWDILNSAAGYVPGMRALIGVLTFLFLLSALIGFAQCFFGYRLFRIFAAIQGFLIGAMLFAALGAATDSGLITFLLFLIGGIGGAVLAYRVYQIGVFITTGFYIGLIFCLVALLSLLVAQDDNFAVVLVAFVIGFVLGGILGVLLSRPLIIISTGLNGFSAVTALVTALHQNPGMISWILGLACSIAGIVFQFKKNPPGTLPGPRSRKWEVKTAQSRQHGTQSFSNAATAAASTATNNLSKHLADLEISQETEELCNQVASYLKRNRVAGAILPYAHIILYIVTAILFLTNSANLFVIPLALCLLCFATQRFEAIFISLTLLILRALPYDFGLLSYGLQSISTWVYFLGLIVIIYVDVMALLTFLKTERGKKLVGRANDSAEAANLRQQQYAAGRQAQQMYAEPVQPQQPYSSYPAQDPIAAEDVGTPVGAAAVDDTAFEPEEIFPKSDPIVSSYGTQTEDDHSAWEEETQWIPGGTPQDEESVSDATVRVSMDEQMDSQYGTVSQQVSSEIQEIMDQPEEPERAIQREFIFCTKCGNRMRSSDNFCTKCGSRLTK